MHLYLPTYLYVERDWLMYSLFFMLVKHKPWNVGWASYASYVDQRAEEAAYTEQNSPAQTSRDERRERGRE